MLARLKNIAQDWLKVSPNVSDYMENNPKIDTIRVSQYIYHSILTVI